MDHFDKHIAGAFAQEARLALAALAEKHGVTIEYRGGKYEATSFEFKMRAVVKPTDGSIPGPEAAAFRVNATFYGLRPEDLGKSVVLGGIPMVITGLNTRSHKMPIILKAARGSMKASAESVRRALATP